MAIGVAKQIFFRWLLTLVASLMASVQAQAADFVLYSYHLKPPFVTDTETYAGFDAALVEQLNRCPGKTRFVFQFLPRKRVMRLLAEPDFKGAILGVNPQWLGDTGEAIYRWTPAYVDDQNEWVSLRSKPFEFSTAQALDGLSFGGVYDFYYPQTEALVKSGKLKRIDSSTELVSLDNLLAGKIGIIIIGRSTLNYVLKQRNLKSVLHVSSKALNRYERRIAVSRNAASEYEQISRCLSAMKNTPDWRKVLNDYAWE